MYLLRNDIWFFPNFFCVCGQIAGYSKERVLPVSLMSESPSSRTLMSWSRWYFWLVLLIGGFVVWLVLHLFAQRPVRSGELILTGLIAPVQVRWDERGVPHIKAENEPDLYQALGYLHAQDRWFQMEMLRRLARGELAEVLGSSLVDVDRLFRTLGIRHHADELATRLDMSAPENKALAAYLAGVNQVVDGAALPLEFELLGMPRRHFLAADTLSISGYLAYSFANGFRAEPVLTFIRDQLGSGYLEIFGFRGYSESLPGSPANSRNEKPVGMPVAALAWGHGAGAGSMQFGHRGLDQGTLGSAARVAAASLLPMEALNVPLFEGSNAWAIGGARSQSGKPILSGDPHIAYAAPAVWWEAHLEAPGISLYGHFNALNPMALLGHNQKFAWSLTMFQNDDVDLVAEASDSAHPGQVWEDGRWVALGTRREILKVKGEPDRELVLRRSAHGPIVNDALEPGVVSSSRPLALWWAWLETPNPLIRAFYRLNRAETLEAARTAVQDIHAPGLNVVWANTAGDIAWWAAGRIPNRPTGVNPAFILDAGKGEARKDGFWPFSANPQEENPSRGYIVSANHQPLSGTASIIPFGYFAVSERRNQLDKALSGKHKGWTSAESSALQKLNLSSQPARILAPLLADLRSVEMPPADRALLDQLSHWAGEHQKEGIEPVIYYQWIYELLKAATEDELGELMFGQMLKVRALDEALPRLVENKSSPWWDRRGTTNVETRAEIAVQSWQGALAHLRATFGADSSQWTWGRAHTLTHGHPLGKKKPLDRVFDIGPWPVDGGREVPDNQAFNLGPAPWAVTYGPSTRRVIDLGSPGRAVGINPVGQSGVLFDKHYADQSADHAALRQQPMWLDEADIARHTVSKLVLKPAH